MIKNLQYLLRIILIVLMTISVSVSAKNLGRVGQIYPIKEMDIVDFIRLQLKQMQQRGELAKINQQIITTIKQRADRPKPVANITPTKTYRSWLVDPSVNFAQDIIGADGQIVVKAGTTVNPLAQRICKTALIFYDGDDKKQVAWATSKDQALRGRGKLILIKGSASEQGRLLKKRIYFDQHGRLTTKFNINHTPALVTQQGLRFKVEELVP